ncbi:MAG TPA: sulfonate ABC transporter substrate-binding protein [Gallionella sp.]|nr:sulfonate ABC transporter substrate-binding protein [Gallionella sp.]
MKSLHRLLSLFVAGVVVTSFASPASAAEELRIGYQKYGTLILLKAHGTLEKRLAPLGVSVTWTEFPAGPQLLEGLNVGSIDFGTVGETPPIFAQAANAQITYIGYEPPAPGGEAIVVPKDSPIKSVADLKGKKIALNKGSNVHYLLVRALEQAGLKYGDVETVFLPPADARAAFERGSVDAWVIWDPFLAAAETSIGARVLKDGKTTVNNHQFYLAEKTYASRRPDVIAATFDELKKVDEWAKTQPKEVAEALAPLTGLNVPTLERALARGGYGVSYLNDKVIAEQQKVADTFYSLKLIPKPLSIREAVWLPQEPKKVAKK